MDIKYHSKPPATPLQVRHSFHPVSPEQYDAVADHTPLSCPLRALGDTRSGRQLLADADTDAAITIGSPRCTAAGAGRLERVAAAFSALCAGLVSASTPSAPPVAAGRPMVGWPAPCPTDQAPFPSGAGALGPGQHPASAQPTTTSAGFMELAGGTAACPSLVSGGSQAARAAVAGWARWSHGVLECFGGPASPGGGWRGVEPGWRARAARRDPPPTAAAPARWAGATNTYSSPPTLALNGALGGGVWGESRTAAGGGGGGSNYPADFVGAAAANHCRKRRWSAAAAWDGGVGWAGRLETDRRVRAGSAGAAHGSRPGPAAEAREGPAGPPCADAGRAFVHECVPGPGPRACAAGSGPTCNSGAGGWGGGLLEGWGRWSAIPPAAGVAAHEKYKTAGAATDVSAAAGPGTAAGAEMDDPFHDDWAFWPGPALRQGGSSPFGGRDRPGPEPCTQSSSPQ